MVLKVYRANNTAISAVKSVVYKAAVNADVDIRPGCVSSAFITVEVFGAQSTAPAVGEALKCYRLDTSGTETLLGIFYAEPAVSSKKTYTVVAYDAIHKLDVDYSARLSEIQEDFPMALADLVDDVCGVAGITCDTTNLPLSTLPINAFYTDGLTCRDMLSYAAELTGQYVVANTSGAAEFSWYSEVSNYRINPSSGMARSGEGEDDAVEQAILQIARNSAYIDGDGDTYYEDLYEAMYPGIDISLIAYKQNGLEYTKYAVSPPPCVAVKPSGVEGAAYIYPTNVESAYATDDGNGNVTLYNLTAVDDGNGGVTLSGNISATDDGDANVTIAATGGSVDDAFVISGNILLTGADESTFLSVAEQVYTQMQLIPPYRPATADLFPLETPFDVGTIVPVKDAQGVVFKMPIMSLTISNSVTIAEATGNEKRIERNSTEKSLANLAATVVQIDRLKVGWAEIDEAIINTVEANELKSSDFVPANDGIYAESGMAIDLAEKNVKAVDFAVDANGKLYASAADLAGVQFGSLKFYNNLTWNPATTQDGYTKFGTISYRNLVEISVSGLTGDTVDAKFDYYNGSTLAYHATMQNIPVASFRIPLFTGTADGVDVWLKNGQSATVYTRNVSNTTAVMTVPSNAQVSFASGISVDGITLNQNTIVAATRFEVAANGSATVSLSNSTRGVLVFSGAGTGCRGLYFWSCDSSGSVVVTDGIAASALTMTTSANSIAVASTSSYIAYGMIINF